MRKKDGIVIFKDWEEEKEIIEKNFKGVFIEKSPSKPELCDVFLTINGAMEKIGQIPTIYLYGGGKRIKEGLSKNIKVFGDTKIIPQIAISTRLNKLFNIK